MIYNHKLSKTRVRQNLKTVKSLMGKQIHAVRQKKRVSLCTLSHRTGIPIQKLDLFEIGGDDIGALHLALIAAGLRTDIESLMPAGF